MRITTCLMSRMVPLKPCGSAVDAAAGPALMPAAAAPAAPSPVACRNRRRLRPCACSRGSSELVIGVPILLVHVVSLTVSTQSAFGNGRTCCDTFVPSRRCLVWAPQTARG